MKLQKIIVFLLVVALVMVGGFGFANLNKVNVVEKVGQVATTDGYVINKLVSYASITTSGVDITNVVQGGDLVLDDIIIRTDDAVAMASGTLFQIVASGNDYGNSTAFSAGMYKMTAAQTFDFSSEDLGDASSTARIILEDGSKLQAKCTGASCKGTNGTTGYLDITMVFKKADQQAYIYE